MADLARSTLTLVVAALGAATLSACAGGGSGGGPDLPGWSVEEELRIGSVDDAVLALSEVTSLAVDDAGRIYVPQWQEGTIRVFDRDGDPVLTIGRRGSGPGEFDRVYSVGFLADSLYVIDFGLRRVSYFSTDGALLRTRQISPPPADPPFYPGMPFAVFPDGSMAPGTAWPANIPMEALNRVPQLRVDPERQLVDTVAWIAYERTARRAVSEGRPLTVGSPLTDDRFAVFALDGSRLATVERDVAPGPATATFGVTVTDGWGDTIYSRRYDYTPVPTAQGVIDDAVEVAAERLEGAFAAPSEARAFVRNAMFLPLYYPPIDSGGFDDQGNLWLRREAIPDQRQRWLVLDPEGEPVAEATLPVGVRVMVTSGDAIWGVVHDDLDVPYVVRYGIDRSGGTQ